MSIERMSIHELAPMLRSGELTPSRLLEACLMQLRDKNPTLNAIVTPTQESARQKVLSLDGMLGDNPLWAIPIAYKDLIETKGVRTTAGSALLMDHIPAESAPVVQQMDKAGAIMVGKASTHEWAFGPTNEVSCFGPCRNPWNPKKITGGSSGGSACAVASGMVVAAFGSDTGGSIRIPAALCGVVGFKPTADIISTKGVFQVSEHMDHIGPLTRSVLDAAYVTDAASGGEGSSGPVSLAKDVVGFTSLQGMTVGVPTDPFFDGTDEEVQRIVDEGIRALEALGARIVEVQIPHSADITSIAGFIVASEAAHYHRERYAKNPLDFSQGVRTRLKNGTRATAVEYIEATRLREEMCRQYAALMQEVDVIACPTCPTAAYNIGQDKILLSGTVQSCFDICPRYTRFGNLLRAPSLSVPCGFTAEGLPVGLMLTGRYADDVTVLRVGHAYEQSVGGFVFPK